MLEQMKWSIKCVRIIVGVTQIHLPVFVVLFALDMAVYGVRESKRHQLEI